MIVFIKTSDKISGVENQDCGNLLGGKEIGNGQKMGFEGADNVLSLGPDYQCAYFVQIRFTVHLWFMYFLYVSYAFKKAFMF